MAVHAGAERDARQLLERLHVTDLPVDPIKIAQTLGVEVWTSDLERDVAGVLVKRGNEPAEIYLNADDHINRQRFTAAHEVGHFFERALKGSSKLPVNFVDYRDDLSSRGTSPSEMYANGFAAALLMPREHVVQLWDQYGDAELMARKFHVSPEAMRHRIRNLNIR